MTLFEANMLMQYWDKNPLAHEILAARYLDRKGGKGTGTNRPAEDPRAAIQELSFAYGMPVEKMPAHISEAIQWAEQQQQKLAAKPN